MSQPNIPPPQEMAQIVPENTQTTSENQESQLAQNPLVPSDQDFLLQQIKSRLEKNDVYTRLGPRSLMLVNPWRQVDSNLTNNMTRYTVDLVARSATEPHIYEMATNAYIHLATTGEDQCMVMSGLSGSGKTETARMALQHLLYLSARAMDEVVGSSLHVSEIQNAILVLEAFGNAGTLTNRNSSRYSSFVELQYDPIDAVVAGCKFSVYAFENQRAAIVPKGERNFHVFHYLIHGATQAERNAWKLSDGGKDGQKFEYLTGNSLEDPKEVLGHINGMTPKHDAENFNQLRTLLRTLGITKKTQSLIFQTLAAILHMGQIHFHRDSEHTSDQCFVKHREPLEIAAQLMGVNVDALEGALTNKSQLVGEVMCTDFLDPKSALESRNNLASTVYSLIFTWLVETINTRLSYKDQVNLGTDPSFIGILDPAGFEGTSQHYVGFQQLQTNYVAEKIQNLVREDLIDQVVTSYMKQGIQLPHSDDLNCLEVFDSKPLGLICLLDDQTTMTNGKEVNVIDGLKKQTFSGNFFSQGATEGTFVIRHHHGDVLYDTRGWVVQNRTNISPDFVKLFRSANAKNPFLASLFQDSRIETQRHPRNGKALVGARRALGNMAKKPTNREAGVKQSMWENAPPKTPIAASPIGGQRRGSMVPPPPSASQTSLQVPVLSPSTNQLKTPISAKKMSEASPMSPVSPGWFVSATVLGHLRGTLDELVSSLREARCWHVFCLSPNNQFELGKPVEVKDDWLRHQIDSLDLVKIGQVAVTELPIRCSFSYFLNRFKTLLFPDANYSLQNPDEIQGTPEQLRQMIVDVCQANEWTSQVTLGQDKIFLDESIYKLLESDLDMSVDFTMRRLHRNQDHVNTEATELLQLWKGCDPCMAGIQLTRSNQALIMQPDGITKDKNGNIVSDEIQKTAQLDSFVSMDQEAMDALDPERGGKKKVQEEVPKPVEISRQRRWWLKITKFMTWWIPEKLIINWGKMTRPEVRQAWREKVALCELIALLSGFLLFFVVGLPALLCPTSNVHTKDEVKQHHSFDAKDMWMAWNGMIYDMSYFYHPTGANDDLSLSQVYFPFAGMDVSPYFPVYDPLTGTLPEECTAPGEEIVPPAPLDASNYPTYDDGTNAKCYVYKNIDGHCHQTADIARKIKYQQLDIVVVGPIAYNLAEIATHNQDTDAWIVINGRIYDVTRIIAGQGIEVGPNTLDIIVNYKGRDASVWAKQLAFLIPCMDKAFFRGVVDNRNQVQCQVSSYILFGVTGLLVGVMIIRFLSALQLGSKRVPEDLDRYTIMMVPCYTEGEESLRKTINSLSLLSYVDERKLLFIIADGMIRGSGNDKSTPELVLDILGINMQAVDADHPPLDYVAVAEGSKQHNRAKVYSGWYSIQARLIPFIVVVKCGTENEISKPGNRGKRDSQMVLMRFLSKVQTRAPMCPMELEVYRQVQVTFGVDPYAYEFVLMVDADTEVMGDSLNRLIACMVHDTRIMGISGETSIANAKSTIVTMIQVYEYYISHYLAKAFESLFGNVTCLPGCFCMYRIRTVGKGKPLLVAPEVIEAYSATNVDTLHKKNLFSLGEDRYLTTLMLKTFPEMRTKFTGDAHCQTVVPDKWEVLLSQRRRWINSTVHNMWELLFINQLCGCLCFSMRFVVFLDLFATLTMPAAVCYLFFLIYASIQSMTVPTISLIMIAIAYGLQVIIFILKRKFEHIGWMIISILATPFFSLALPMYSYWHFDDFSWGNTRRVAGTKDEGHVDDEEKFDASVIQQSTWEDYAQAQIIEAQKEMMQPDPNMIPPAPPIDANMALTSAMPMSAAPSIVPSMVRSVQGDKGYTESQLMQAFGGLPSMNSGMMLSNPMMNPMLSNAMMPNPMMSMPSMAMYGGFMMPSMIAGTMPGMPTIPGAIPNLTPNQLPGSKPPVSAVTEPLKKTTVNVVSPQPNTAPGQVQSQPTNDQLLAQVKHIVTTGDLATLTKKKVREQLAQMNPGVDLTSRKQEINDMVDRVLAGTA